MQMRRAKLFRNGSSQAVRLPKDCRFEGTEVYVKSVGRAVILLPVDGTWESLQQSLELFTPDFLAERIQPEPEERGSLN